MSGMGDGYVGTAQDAVRIRRLEKQREAERKKIQELKTKSASAKDQPGLLQFGSSTSEVPFFVPNLGFSICFDFRFHSEKSEKMAFFSSNFSNFLLELSFFVCSQILETAFKKETVGLVTREEYVEKVS